MMTFKEEAIVQLIMSRLGADMRTCGQTIDVIVTDGEITLIGTCDSNDQKATARMIVLGTCGVKQVIDNVRVRPFAQSI